MPRLTPAQAARRPRRGRPGSERPWPRPTPQARDGSSACRDARVSLCTRHIGHAATGMHDMAYRNHTRYTGAHLCVPCGACAPIYTRPCLSAVLEKVPEARGGVPRHHLRAISPRFRHLATIRNPSFTLRSSVKGTIRCHGRHHGRHGEGHVRGPRVVSYRARRSSLVMCPTSRAYQT